MRYILCTCGNLIVNHDKNDNKYVCHNCGLQPCPHFGGTGVELTKEYYFRLVSVTQPNIGREVESIGASLGVPVSK